MTGFQEFIKYIAIVLGAYLSIVILLALIGIARDLVGTPENDGFENIIEDREEYDTRNYLDEGFDDILDIEESQS